MSVQVLVWSLVSALFFAGTFIVIRLGRTQSNSLTILWVTLTVNVVALLILLPLFGQFDLNKWWDWRFLVYAGVFAPLLGRLFQFIGMDRIGVNITTPITLTHPLVSMLIALAFLDSTVSSPQLMGAGLILVGTLVVGWQSSSTKNDTISVKGRAIYIVFPILASLAYGVSNVYRKVAIDLGTDPVTASTVLITTSWLCVSVYILASSRVSSIRATRKELAYFILAGVFSTLGPIFYFIALAEGSLIVVAPLASTTPIFVLIGSWFLTREVELFNRAIILGTLVTVVGMMVMTSSI